MRYSSESLDIFLTLLLATLFFQHRLLFTTLIFKNIWQKRKLKQKYVFIIGLTIALVLLLAFGFKY